jgi:GrpB-like predicted nucleotidyltransferase (UPF0157 family)
MLTPPEPRGDRAASAVELAAPNPWWPQIFKQESVRLCRALHCQPDMLEHIGSTAVAGLVARPVVDIAIGTGPCAPLDTIAAIVDLGYASLGATADPARLLFRRRHSQSFDLEVIEFGGARWRDHLLLRDYLRGTPAACARYAADKRAAAADGATYDAAKAAALEALLTAARTAG